MAIFRRHQEDAEPEPESPLEHLDDYSSPDGDDVSTESIDQWTIPGRGSRAAHIRGPRPAPPSDDEVRSLEQRLLASLHPGPAPAVVTGDEPSSRVEEAAEPGPAPPPLLKDRPSRPNPGTDIYRAIRRAVTRALAEDLGDQGDITVAATILPGARGTAVLIAREAGVLAGLELVAETYAMLDPRVTVELDVEDGDRVDPGQQLGTITGPLRSILTGERVALNFVAHLSGIATATARYVDAVAGTRAVIRDTRKTTPGLRLLEKMAVVAGGGVNHRLGLFDALLVKDNHNLGAGDVGAATRRALARANERPVQVEVTSVEEMDAAVEAGATDIMLDNFDLDTLAIAVARAPAEVTLEASGGITLDNVAEVASTGVGRIAIGALTHSANWLDVALDVTVVAADPPPALAALASADVVGDDLVDDLVVEEAPADEDTGAHAVVDQDSAEDVEVDDDVEDSAAFVEDASFPVDDEELEDEEALFADEVIPWSSEVDGLGQPSDGEVVPLEVNALDQDTSTNVDDLMIDLGLRGDTALEDLAQLDDDVPVPDDDVVDAFLDELDRDAGTADLAADEVRD